MINTNYALSSVNLRANKAKNTNKSTTNPQYASKNSLELPNYTYNQLQIKKSNVSFAGASRYLKDLENTVSVALKKMKDDDILIIGDRLKSAQLENGGFLAPVINKIHFIEDKGIQGAFAVSKTEEGGVLLTNLTKGNVVLDESKVLPSGDFTSVSWKTRFDTENSFFFINPKNNVTQTSEAELEKNIKSYDVSKLVPNEDFSLVRYTNNQRLKTLIKTLEPEKIKAPNVISFDSVGGLDDVKDQLKKSVIWPIKYPNAFKNKSMGKGVLLYGPTGTGKTYLSKAVAGEADANFFQINGSELDGSLVGETEKKWRELFDKAVKNQPSIIFVDEADAALRKRTEAETGRYDNKSVDQVLSLLSDVEKNNDNVFFMASTNCPELIDPAMLRPGRMGLHIEIPNPDAKGCLDILNVQTKGKNISPDMNKEEFAKKLSEKGRNGSSIKFIVEEADNNAMEEAGVFKEMEKGIYDDSKGELNLELTQEYFDKALETSIKQDLEKEKKKNPMGFTPNNKVQ